MKLRPMTMEDADRMLEWKNYSETRKFTILGSHRIKKADHYEYLKKNIEFFKIILHNNKVCGAVRIQEKEVSIWIDRKFRGKGIAVEVIKKVSRLGFKAKIVKGNVASMICFLKCGFWPVSYYGDYYLLEKIKI